MGGASVLPGCGEEEEEEGESGLLLEGSEAGT